MAKTTINAEVLTKLDFGMVVRSGDTLIVIAKNDDAESCYRLKEELAARLSDVDIVVLSGVQQLAVVRTDGGAS